MLGSSLSRIAAFAALLTLLLVGWERYAERDLRRIELERRDRSLEATAHAVVAALEGQAIQSLPAERLAGLASLTARAAGARVTLIDAAGIVRADSEVSAAQLASIENHGSREEVVAARAGGVGKASRLSGTVGRELRYVAIPAPGGGVVRVSADQGELDVSVSHSRTHALGLAAIAVLGSIALLQLFFWLDHRRPLREVRRMAAAIADGRLDVRVPRTPDDDLGRIARAINQIAGQLRARLHEVTREKEQLGAVLEGMVEGVLVVDARGGILLANTRFRELFDIHVEIVGRPLLEGVRNTDLDAILAETAQINATVARRIVLSGSTPRILQVQAARFPTEGVRVGTVAVLHDVTELMRLEEVRRNFVANASHELRTPLAAIRGFAETLLESAALSPTEQKAYLEVINRHAQRLSNLVEDLLELSTIESRTLRLDIAPVNVQVVAEDLIADWRLRLEEREIAVSTRVDGSPLAMADARALDQIFTNLLDNAVKYTEPGGSIEVAVEERPTRVRVSVRDSGIGIPAEELSRIFERFYRVDKARSRALGGTGLGLSIVKHLVQTMEGEIFVESQLGRGSTFVFHLPKAPASEAAEQRVPSPPA